MCLLLNKLHIFEYNTFVLGQIVPLHVRYVFRHVLRPFSNRTERDHWGDLGVDGWIILGWISRRWDVGMWTGLGWPRRGTGGGHL